MRKRFISEEEDGAAVFKKWGKPRFKPNEKYEYSNPGYEMLGLIVERVSKKSFAEFLDAAIFEPLGSPVKKPQSFLYAGFGSIITNTYKSCFFS